MGTPIDRTAKTALDGNLSNGLTSDAPKIKNNNDVVYNYVDTLNSAQDAHAAATTLPHADSSVTGPKIRDGAVTTAKIADGAVTAAKVANASLTADKFVAGALQNETQNGLEIVALKAKNVVNVEDFTGANVLIKIQNAIDYALVNRKYLEFTKLYDITGLGPLSIIKAYPYIGTFYIVGNGGGIKKDDAGYIFQNPVSTPRISDFNISGMYFESSTIATVTNVWDLDYFLRINSSDNTYNGIDSVFRTDNQLVQSCRFVRESIRGGNGYAFYAISMIDVTIAECLIEDRNSGWGYTGGGIANTVSSSNVSGGVSNFNIRIENNVIEGLDLEGVKLGNCVSSKITGNYMEDNNGYYDLYTLVDAGNYNISLDFSGNHTQQTTDQVTALTPALKIKNILATGTTYKQKSDVLFSNNRALGVLYETNSASFINSIGDFSSSNKLCVPIENLILVGGMNPLPANGGIGALATTKSGISFGFQKTQSATLTASEKKIVSITVTNAYFASPITQNSVVSIQISDLTNAKVNGYNWSFTSTNVATVNVALENVSAGSITFTVSVNVINLGD